VPRDPHSAQTLPSRLEQALRELPLTEAEIAAMAKTLSGSYLLRHRKIADAGSPFFDIRRKADALIAHFAADGLTLDAYLRAAARRPSLLAQSPATLCANLETVMHHWARHGLKRKDYLAAALYQPSLFQRAPASIIANMGVFAYPREKV
jgi:hypothetical protein